MSKLAHGQQKAVYDSCKKRIEDLEVRNKELVGNDKVYKKIVMFFSNVSAYFYGKRFCLY